MNTLDFKRSNYPRIRAELLALHNEILKLPNKEDLYTCARHLGLLHKKVMRFNNESEVSLLAEYQVYAYRPRGFNLAELYLRINRASLSEFQLEFLARMSTARFAVLLVDEVGNDETLRVTDILRKDSFIVVDQGLSSTLRPKHAFASHIIDMSDYSIQTGAVLPADRALMQSDEPMRVLNTLSGKVDGVGYHISSDEGSKLARAVYAAAIRMGYTERVEHTDYK